MNHRYSRRLPLNPTYRTRRFKTPTKSPKAAFSHHRDVRHRHRSRENLPPSYLHTSTNPLLSGLWLRRSALLKLLRRLRHRWKRKIYESHGRYMTVTDMDKYKEMLGLRIYCSPTIDHLAGESKEVTSRFDQKRISDCWDNDESSSEALMPEHRHQKPSLLPATEPPHSGTSLYPSYSDHQDLLREVLGVEKRKGREETSRPLTAVPEMRHIPIMQDTIAKMLLELAA